jgi:Entner-Doudoroff aldolase
MRSSTSRGIGTVLTPEDLATARGLGVRFAVSPGATPEMLDAAANGELPFIPGVQPPSELMAALIRGFDVVKFSPAVPAGSIVALKALAGPFPQVRFCPTGGIGEETFLDWLTAQRRLGRRLLGSPPRPTSAPATGPPPPRGRGERWSYLKRRASATSTSETERSRGRM